MESDPAPPWGYLPVEQYLIVSQYDVDIFTLPSLVDMETAEMGS